MSTKVIKVKWFSVPEWEKEEKWLRSQHNKGLKLVQAIVPGIYIFERCEREDVIYQLDFNQEGLNNRSQYIQMFHDCGWEYVTEMAGYSYFRKPVADMKEDEENIFSDDESKMDMIQRVYKGRMSFLVILFCCIVIPQLFMQWNGGNIRDYLLFGAIALIFVLYVAIFIKFAIVYHKQKKKMKKIV